MVKSKTTCLKWQFGQIKHGGKKTILGGFFFLLNFLVKKVVISYNVPHIIFDDETLNFMTS